MNLDHQPSADGGCTIRLSGELTIYHAAELRQALLPLLAGAPSVEIDLEDVTDIDSAGIQVLLAVRKTLAAQGAALRVPRHGAAVTIAFALLGLAGGLAALASPKEARSEH